MMTSEILNHAGVTSAAEIFYLLCRVRKIDGHDNDDIQWASLTLVPCTRLVSLHKYMCGDIEGHFTVYNINSPGFIYSLQP